MATLALAAAGASIGSALLPAGVSALGFTLSGAAIGSQLGALAGSAIDGALFGASGRARQTQGPRLQNLHVTASTEGAPVPRLYGRARLGGQIIWATDIEEEAVSSSTGSGSSKGTSSTTTSTAIEYRYYANVAVALCEGPATTIHRIWADGVELDRGAVTWRFWSGRADQPADPLIVAHESAATRAYRGIAYVVFERLPLASWGNRIPQFSFEVERAVDGFADLVRAVVLIPGAGEFAYDPVEITRVGADGHQVAENVHTRQGGTDWTVAVDQLEAALPNARRVSLVVSWFGTDLRAASCDVRPAVELHDKSNAPEPWRVAGLERASAARVSTRDSRPAYGGTPSDATVVRALRDLAARGIAVTLTPFVLMDIAQDNARPDPWSGAPTQPAYPWRGRITVDPAPGRPATADRTVTAATQLAAFVGTARPEHFSIVAGEVVYAGPDEWSYRRHILHYAVLAKLAGGVDTFVIGTELKGLTTVRDATGGYPFVAALAALAADVRAVLGPSVKITYAADWSEWFGHAPPETPGAFVFHLDPLWAAPAIDAIGIDLYWPLADWRSGPGHLDWQAGFRATHDPAYLRANVRGGEGFDWYYASAADRAAQRRTPITDGLDKPWIWRFKDIASWWSNPHVDRPAGAEAEAATPTAWVPYSKPVWFMEVGAPAVDKAANQPNVFVDPKSSETALPYFSDGRRDDLIQRRVIEAVLTGFAPAHEGGVPGANPISPATGAAMVDLDRAHVYCWDARPYPAFPADADAWGDAGNWRLGHWISGRSSSVPVSALVAAILEDWGFTRYDTAALPGTVPGCVIDRVMSARDALQAIELAFFCDAVETQGVIRFVPRAATADVIDITPDEIVETRPGADLLVAVRAQDRDLPASAKLTYLDPATDYAQAVAEARRLPGASLRVAQAELPLVLESDQAGAIAESWLFETWAARERVRFCLPPSRIAVEAGDIVRLPPGAPVRLVRVVTVSDHGPRELEALSVDPVVYEPTPVAARDGRATQPRASGAPTAVFVDLPLLRGDEPETAAYIAIAQTPWPGPVAILRSPGETGFTPIATANAPAGLGTLLDTLSPGPLGVFDRAARVRVRLESGQLASASELQVLAGANTLAVLSAAGVWEVVQFSAAELVAPSTYRLTGLLRAQAGTEAAMAAGSPAGTRVVILDDRLTRLDLAPSEIGLPLNWKIGPSSEPLSSARVVTRPHTVTGQAAVPLSPVHVRAARRPGGDIALSWIRRTRRGGDTWEADDVPLAEAAEGYDVRILSGTAVRRTFTVSIPALVYTSADQLADFGSPPSSLTVEVRQRGTRGLGPPLRATLPL